VSFDVGAVFVETKPSSAVPCLFVDGVVEMAPAGATGRHRSVRPCGVTRPRCA
jgi:hypothetical protein